MSSASLVQQAAEALRRGDRPGAKALLRQALEANPIDTDSLIASARMAQAEGDKESALQFARRAALAAPDRVGAIVMCSELEYTNGNFANAEKGFVEAVRLTGGSSALWFNVGIARYAQADYQGAADAYARAQAADPSNDDARRNGIMSLAGAGQRDAAISASQDYLASRRGTPGSGFDVPLPEGESHTTRFKLEHDYQQLRFLLETGDVSNDLSELSGAYNEAIAELADLDANAPVERADRHGSHWALIERYYNRPVNVPAIPELVGPLINPELDIATIETRYLDSKPNLTYVDELLVPDALQALREFLFRATIWYDIKPNYLGAYFIEGFANALTLGIAEGLRRALPRVFGAHRLTQSWAYKYGPRLTGIPTHADAAAVNVNFWIAPDEANLDPQSGGLKVYNIAAPNEWDFEQFNNDQEAMAALLSEHRDDFVRIPHRCNRAVIFDSSLFHETDTIHFVDDYLSRRINVTILYGLRDA